MAMDKMEEMSQRTSKCACQFSCRSTSNQTQKTFLMHLFNHMSVLILNWTTKLSIRVYLAPHVARSSSMGPKSIVEMQEILGRSK